MTPAIEPTRTTLAIAEILAALGTEMSRLAQLADLAQLVAGRVLASDSHVCEETLASLQGLDVLTQTLTGLNSFLTSLGRQIPADWSIDAAPATQNLVLSALVTRLTAKLPAGNDGHYDSWSNNVELF